MSLTLTLGAFGSLTVDSYALLKTHPPQGSDPDYSCLSQVSVCFWGILATEAAASFSVCISSVVSNCVTPWAVTTPAPRLLSLWNSPGKNTGVGCYFLLQGIFPTQIFLNLDLLHCRQILYHLSHQASH